MTRPIAYISNPLVRPSAERDPDALAKGIQRAGMAATMRADGSIQTDATPDQVGEVALAERVVLTELRAADGAGLEEMFLELTADTQREGAAA